MTDYDNVCRNQSAFNDALQKASDKQMVENRTINLIWIVLWVCMTLYAFSLISKMNLDQKEKIEHSFFALLAPPLYLISHYLANKN